MVAPSDHVSISRQNLSSLVAKPISEYLSRVMCDMRFYTSVMYENYILTHENKRNMFNSNITGKLSFVAEVVLPLPLHVAANTMIVCPLNSFNTYVK